MIAAVERIALITAGAVLGVKLLSGISWWVFVVAVLVGAGAYLYQRYDK